MKHLTFSLFLLFSPLFLVAQITQTIRGIVVDQETITLIYGSNDRDQYFKSPPLILSIFLTPKTF